MIVYHGGVSEIRHPDLARAKKLSLRAATDVYYSSRLSGQIAQGLYGIDNLDYKYLVDDLIENEPELF